MRVIVPLLGLSALLMPTAQAAVPQDVLRIFDKKQRTLEAPPAALTADNAEAQSRYASGLERVQRAVGSGPSEEPADEASSPPAAVPAQRKIVIMREPREVRRAAGGRSYTFDGRRTVGVGFVGAGTYGIFGTEADLSFGDGWSGGVGIGTGMSYSAWGLYGRYYFHEEQQLSPFFQFGYAHWYMSRAPRREKEVYPLYLGEQFLQEKDGTFKAGKRVHMIYPAMGVLYQGDSGLAATFQLQYLLGALNFRGALAGSFGLHFYF